MEQTKPDIYGSKREPQRVMRIDKTRQDQMPVDKRPRVAEWHQRIAAMKKKAGQGVDENPPEG